MPTPAGFGLKTAAEDEIRS